MFKKAAKEQESFERVLKKCGPGENFLRINLIYTRIEKVHLLTNILITKFISTQVHKTERKMYT